MNPKFYNNRNKSTLDAKSRRDSIPWWLRFIVDFSYEYSFVWIGAIAILFIVIVITGNLFTVDGLYLALGNLTFIILFILKKRIEKLDEFLAFLNFYSKKTID